jgi:hypothetical protein
MSPLKKLALTHEGSGIERMETIQAYTIPPWHNRISLVCEADRQATITAAKDTTDIIIATNASNKEGLIGISNIIA